MPFRTEHSCRIRQPGLFEPDSFRRIETDSAGWPLVQVMGRLRGEQALTLQAFRYPALEADIAKGWTEDQARRHCANNEGEAFQAADLDLEPGLELDVDGDETISRRLRAHAPASLSSRSSPTSEMLRVDRKAGILRGISVIEQGPAIGHGFLIDETTVDEVVALGNRRESGVKSRFTHPDACHDGLGTELGRVTTFRKSEDGMRALADLHLIDAAEHSPEGNLRKWALEIADEDPGLVAVSIHFGGRMKKQVDEDGEEKRDAAGNPLPPILRVSHLHAADMVDTGAANRRGLFGTSEFSALAAGRLDSIDLLEFLDGPQLAAGEADYLAIAREAFFDLDLPTFTAGESSFQLTGEPNLLRVSAWLNRYLERRGIVHDPIDPAMLERLISHLQPEPKDDPMPPDPKPKTTDDDQKQALVAARQSENDRVREIRALGQAFPAYELATTLEAAVLDLDCTIDAARRKVLDVIAKQQQAPESIDVPGVVQVGATALSKFISVASDALSLRYGLPLADAAKEEARKSGLGGVGMKQLARECLRLGGERNVDRMPDSLLFERAMGGHRTVAIFDESDPTMLQAVGHATGDFPLILANQGNKALVSGFETSPDTWRIWTKMGDLRDFKTAKRLRLSESPHLKLRPPGLPAEQGTFNEKGEDITLENYAEAFSYTRQMFVNDDLGAFLDLGRRFGRGASATIERLLYESLVLSTGVGPTMSDSKALFHVDHLNLNSDGAAAPSQTSLDAMTEALMIQIGTGEDGAKTTVGSPPRFFLAKPSLAAKIAAIIDAPFRGTTNDPALEQPQDPDLRAARAIKVPQLSLLAPGNDWYGVADQDSAPSYEIAFLNRVSTPRTKTIISGTVDGTTIVVDLDFAIFPTGGWEGINRNAGA